MSAIPVAPDESAWTAHSDETFLARMGPVVERRRDGMIEIGLQTDDSHKNLSGIVHGGIAMTLIDRAIGLNCRAVADGDPMSTATLTVNFLRRIKVGDFMTVSCVLTRKGRKAMFANAQVHVGDQLAATATGICMKLA
jgi:uncharacterized protein (TIGR00369 family)